MFRMGEFKYIDYRLVVMGEVEVREFVDDYKIFFR